MPCKKFKRSSTWCHSEKRRSAKSTASSELLLEKCSYFQHSQNKQTANNIRRKTSPMFNKHNGKVTSMVCPQGTVQNIHQPTRPWISQFLQTMDHPNHHKASSRRLGDLVASDLDNGGSILCVGNLQVVDNLPLRTWSAHANNMMMLVNHSNMCCIVRS
jgi:hypothetical protein